jgi:hypothetical protein
MVEERMAANLRKIKMPGRNLIRPSTLNRIVPHHGDCVSAQRSYVNFATDG